MVFPDALEQVQPVLRGVTDRDDPSPRSSSDAFGKSPDCVCRQRPAQLEASTQCIAEGLWPTGREPNKMGVEALDQAGEFLQFIGAG